MQFPKFFSIRYFLKSMHYLIYLGIECLAITTLKLVFGNALSIYDPGALSLKGEMFRVLLMNQ